MAKKNEFSVDEALTELYQTFYELLEKYKVLSSPVFLERRQAMGGRFDDMEDELEACREAVSISQFESNKLRGLIWERYLTIQRVIDDFDKAIAGEGN